MPGKNQLREELGRRCEVLAAGEEGEAQCLGSYLLPRTSVFLAPTTWLFSQLQSYQLNFVFLFYALLLLFINHPSLEERYEDVRRTIRHPDAPGAHAARRRGDAHGPGSRREAEG